MCRSRRQRSVIVLLLTACLLLQQLAMSALACTMPVPARAAPHAMTASTSMAADCLAAMTGKQARDPGMVCEKHCSPDATSANAPSIPPLPALTLPPMLHALAPPPASRRRHFGWDALFARSDPPTRLRYCRLLI